MMMPSGVSWGAIGLGSDVMEGSLIFLIYPSASGQGVTMSPRLSTGHTEPVYTPDIKVEALDGTGFFNDTYIFNGRCSNCRTWNGGSRKVNVASKADNMLYATGESGNYLKSDALDGPLKWHYNYGTFTMDMVLATGPGGVPVIDRSQNSKLIGTVQHESEQGSMDAKLIVHAVIMVFVFLGLYPFGIFVLRLGGWVRWHGWNQGAALILTIMGSGLGFAVSSSYNRVRLSSCRDIGAGDDIDNAFTDQIIQHCPPSHRHSHLYFHNRPVRVGLLPSPHIQEDSTDDQDGPYSCVAGSPHARSWSH